MIIVDGHPHTGTFGRTPEDRCPTCLSRDCLHRTYSVRYIRFLLAHIEVYESACAAYNGAASNQLERLEREYKTLPPRHVCSCEPGHCRECRRIDKERAPWGQDVAPVVGRSWTPGPVTPPTILLDVLHSLPTTRTEEQRMVAVRALARRLSGGK